LFLLPNTEKVYQFLSVATQLQVAMLLSKPLTAGIVLIALSALSQGRVIQPSTQDGHIADLAIRAETLAGTTPDICHFHQDLISCTEGPVLDVLDSYHWKRAPPRVRPGKNDENTPQDGSSSQTGGEAQDGGGAQTGGKKQDEEDTQTSTQNDDDTPSAPPPVIRPPTDPVAPAAPTVLAAYTDVPKDFNVPGRAPGQDVLPNEIPDFRGLSTSAEDAARRASFQRFVNWDIQSSNLIPPGSHYLLFLGDTARASRITFKNEFNIQRKHTDNLSPNDQSRVVDNTDVYNGIALGDDMVPVPPSMAGSESRNHWLSMLESYGMAKRAAARGGTVRVLVDTNVGTNTVNRDRLFQEGSFFHNFELGVVTGPDTQVQSVLAYGARDVTVPDPVPGNRFQTRQVWTFTPPEQIWSTGQPQLGKTPDWIDGTIPKDNREGFREEDELINLGDFR
jgi:hypothetical protein